MSQKVLAWTFDPQAFHGWLLPRVLRHGALDVAALAAAAEEVASTRAPSVLAYLEALRIHPDEPESWESIFTLDPDVDSSDELYAIAMGGHLHAAAQVSFWSHDLAGVALSKLGWEGNPALVWLGHRLTTLADSSGSDALARAMSRARGSLGGWLSLDDAQRYLKSLVTLRTKPLPPDMREWFRGMASALPPEELRERVDAALTELTSVIADAVDREESLRLVYWS